MSDQYFADKTFKTSKQIEKGEYENCRFLNCTLPKSDLSGISFIECEFENCDISSSKLFDTSFKTVSFIQSKLVGLRFEDCNEFLFSIDFRECNLNLSSFYKLKPKHISFSNCNLKKWILQKLIWPILCLKNVIWIHPSLKIQISRKLISDLHIIFR